MSACTTHSPAAAERLGGWFVAMPKVELHIHLEGSIAPSLLFTLAERNGLNLPWTDLEETEKHYRSIGDFDSFKRMLLLAASCLRRPEDLELVVRQAGAMLARQNVRYVEMSWTPQLWARSLAQLEACLEAMNSAREDLRASYGMEMRWIPDLVRSYPGPARTVAQWACKPENRKRGIVALGLAGPEETAPASRFSGIFAFARARGLPANPHAGEGTSAARVAETLDQLRPRRIGHGVSAAEDPALMARLAAAGVLLEICPTSNVRLGHYPDYSALPLRRLLDAGCRVNVNSDDPALFLTTLTEEYRHAVESCGMTPAELERSVLDALAASHLPEQEKAALQASVCREQERLRETLAPC
jgi:adenosine deaminase